MIKLLRKRRSIRKYTNKPVPSNAIKRLKEALLRSPSSRDTKPWRFIFLNDSHLLQRVSLCKSHGAEFLAKASLGIIICGDESKSDVWIEDCSIASILVQMAALEVGLGTCWIQVRNRSTSTGVSSEMHIRNQLKLPAHMRILSIIACGFPAEKKKPIPSRKLLYSSISTLKSRTDFPK